MACQEYESRLADLEDYLDGKLSGGKVTEIEAHIERCAACREELEAAREAGRLLRAAFDPVREPGAFFWLRVHAGIRAAKERQEFWGTVDLFARRLVWSATLAVTLLAGYLGTQGLLRESLASPPSEGREIFSEPVQQPANPGEVLLALASEEK